MTGLKKNKVKKYKFWIIFFVIFAVASSISGYYFFFRTYYSVLDLSYSFSKCPVVIVEIEDKKYPFKVDTGSKFAFTMPESLLKSLKYKKKGEKVRWRDFKGNRYESYLFCIPKVTLGTISLKNFSTKLDDSNFYKNTGICLSTKPKTINYGRIGWPVFLHKKVLFDFRKDKVFITNDMQRLKEEGYNLDQFAKGILIESQGIYTIEVDTDIGKKRFILDTGATCTIIKDNLAENKTCEVKAIGLKAFSSAKFSIFDKDFGPKDIFPLNIAPTLKSDGVLGMDFLKDHVIYIDYANELLYMQ